MAKFRPARGKRSSAARPPQGAVACVVLVISGILLIMLFLYFVLRNANG